MASRRGKGQDHDHHDGRSGLNDPAQRRRDPTLVRNQPALRTSSGTIWVVVGGLFVIACLIPLSLIVVTGGSAATTAAVTIALVLVLYAVLFVARFAVAPGVRRLRLMAVCLLGVAIVALGGMLLCVAIQRQLG